MKIINRLLSLFGVVFLLFILWLEISHNLISQLLTAPKFDDNTQQVYIRVAKKLLTSGDITQATTHRVAIDDDISNEDVEEAMASVAVEYDLRGVGELPLSEQVELQTGETQPFAKVYQYCSPRIAMDMIRYSLAFSAFVPCRIALVEDGTGKRWLYTLDMDVMIFGGKPLPDELKQKALNVKEAIYAIMERGAKGEF